MKELLEKCHFLLSNAAKFKQPVLQADIDNAVRGLKFYIRVADGVDDKCRGGIIDWFKSYSEKRGGSPELRANIKNVCRQMELDTHMLNYYETYNSYLLRNNSHLQDKVVELQRELDALKNHGHQAVTDNDDN